MRSSRNVGAVFCALLSSSLLVASCGPGQRPLSPKSQTWGELRTVRQGVQVQEPGEGKRAPYPRERLVDGEKITIEEGGLAWLRRDGGAKLLVAGPASLEMQRDAIAVKTGKVFVDTPPGIITDVTTERGALHLSHVRASLEAREDGSVDTYVLSGEVRTETGAFAGPGETLALKADKAERLPVLSWEDWTGGLATTDRGAAPSPFGVGTVGARLPGEAGKPRWPLAIHKLDVRVKIHAEFAITEVDQTFFNPTSERVEGIYRFRTPPGAMLHRFGVDRAGGIVWGYVKEKQQAAAQYESHVYAGSREDPALLEWDAPGVYQARLYPIEPGDTRRVVTRYAQWLPRTGDRGQRRLYVYPMAADGDEASLPHIEELTISINLEEAAAQDIRAGMNGVRDGKEIVVRAHDFVPRADLAIELFDEGLKGIRAYRAPHEPDLDVLPPGERGEATRLAKEERDYLLVPLRPDRVPQPEGGLDLAIVVDSSAATDTASLTIAQAATKALLAHLGKDDRVAVWAGDVGLRPVVKDSEKLLAADPSRSRELLRGLAQISRGGATDLGAILAEAAAQLEPKRRGAVVYIGDGKPTVGELSLADLRTRLDRLPRPVRLFTLGVGDDADMGILAGVAHGAVSARITDGNEAALAALRLLEEAERPTWLGVSVSLGNSVERVYPRDLGARPADESLLLIGRITGDEALPAFVELDGPAGASKVPMTVQPMKDQGDLMRRWAEGRLVQLLDTGAGRAAVVEVGARYGVVTPFTSLYVPTTDEARRQNLLVDWDPNRDRQQKIQAQKKKKRPRRSSGFFGLGSKADEAETEMVAEDNADNKEGGTGTRAKGEEGSMGNPNSRDTNKRYGVAGPKGNADPHIARSAALREAAEFGMVGLLNTGAGGDGDAPTAPANPWGGGKRAGGRGPGDPMAGDIPRAQNAASAPPAASAAVDSLIPKVPTEEIADNQDKRVEDGRNVAGKSGKWKAQNKISVNLEAMQNARIGNVAQLEQQGFFPQTTSQGRFRSAESANYKQNVNTPAQLGNQAVRCGPGALVPLSERVSLWSERLAAVRGQVHGVLSVYRSALGQCEAPSWRERSRLLSLMVDAMPSVEGRVRLWRQLASTPGVGDAVYGMILLRVKNAAEMRALHDAMGIRSIDPKALEVALRGANTPAAQVAKLRELVKAWPDDLVLHLLLLDALEDAGDKAGARDLARDLRAQPTADTTVRTAVGELFLRFSVGKDDADAREGLRTFGEIVEFAPDDPVARRRLGDLLRAHGRFAQSARQYETLSAMLPDDATVPLLRAAAAQGLGKVEEAVRWTEKASGANAPDGASGSAKTARALALTYLSWARAAARKDGKKEVLTRLLARTKSLVAADGAGPGARVSLAWAHPDFHPVLWSDALGSMMPASEGDPMLGIAQVRVPTTRAARVEVRLEPEEAKLAARFGLTAVLTVVFDEGTDKERIVQLPVQLEGADDTTLSFLLNDGSVTAGGAR
jgi:tetratricopeptide (TPR) repeat protein